jgi:hypothetical protein
MLDPLFHSAIGSDPQQGLEVTQIAWFARSNAKRHQKFFSLTDLDLAFLLNSGSGIGSRYVKGLGRSTKRTRRSLGRLKKVNPGYSLPSKFWRSQFSPSSRQRYTKIFNHLLCKVIRDMI